MEAVVRICPHLDVTRVEQYLSALRIPSLSIARVTVPAKIPACPKTDPHIFYVDVSLGGQDFDEDRTQEHLDNYESSLFLFNPSVPDEAEPKVIYMTDHSAKANSNLEMFKQLKPKGFLGATVVSESETAHPNLAWNDVSAQILERVRGAVQTTRANLIIANYDLHNTGRRFSRMACLSKLVGQNRCHVLILKA